MRKAYKELEREGLVTTERGVGTFASGKSVSNFVLASNGDRKSELIALIRSNLTELLETGGDVAEIRDLIDQTIHKASRHSEERRIVFAECNSLQAEQIAEVVRNYLGVSVTAVLLKDLKDEVAKVSASGFRLTAVITTGFHINEVRTILGDPSIQTDFVIANMSPETRRTLDRYDKTSRFAFVCRDPESKYYRDILKAELDIESDIACCTIQEKATLGEILSSADILLTAPSVYESIKKMAPPKVPVFNVQDRVDPLSLKMLKDRMSNLSSVSQ